MRVLLLAVAALAMSALPTTEALRLGGQRGLAAGYAPQQQQQQQIAVADEPSLGDWGPTCVFKCLAIDAACQLTCKFNAGCIGRCIAEGGKCALKCALFAPNPAADAMTVTAQTPESCSYFCAPKYQQCLNQPHCPMPDANTELHEAPACVQSCVGEAHQCGMGCVSGFDIPLLERKNLNGRN